MKSPSFLSLFFLLLPACLLAQETEPVILLSATGKVIYQSPAGGKVVQVYAGALLLPDGKVAVKGKGTATLQYKKSLRQISNRDLEVISSLIDASHHSIGFPASFAGVVEDAFVMAFFSPDDPALPWSQLGRRKGMGDGWGIAGGDTRDTSKQVDSGPSGDGWGIAGGNTRDTSKQVDSGPSGDGWGIAGGNTRDTSKQVDSGPSGDGWGIAGGNTRDTSKQVDSGPSGDGWTIQGGDTRDTSARVTSDKSVDGFTIKGGDTRDTSARVTSDKSVDGFSIKGGDTRDTSARVASGTPIDGWGIRGSDTRDTSGTVLGGATGDGFGKTGTRLQAYLPYGYVSDGIVTFYWSSPEPAGTTYIVEVLQPDGQSIAKGTTRETSLILTLAKGLMDANTVYYWQVRVAGDRQKVSNGLQLVWGLPDERQEILDRVTQSQLFLQSPPDVQALMRAVAFEKAEWFGEAEKEYRQAIGLQGRNGQSARLMLARFWESQTVRSQATAAFRR